MKSQKSILSKINLAVIILLFLSTFVNLITYLVYYQYKTNWWAKGYLEGHLLEIAYVFTILMLHIFLRLKAKRYHIAKSICVFLIAFSLTVAELALIYDIDFINAEYSLFNFFLFIVVTIIYFLDSLFAVIFAILNTDNAKIKRKERIFKKVDKIHSYYLSGSITQQEFEDYKKELLKQIK